MTTEKMMELSEQLTDAMREEGLYKAQQALQGDGSDECEDCGSVIPEARRKAMPMRGGACFANKFLNVLNRISHG